MRACILLTAVAMVGCSQQPTQPDAPAPVTSVTDVNASSGETASDSPEQVEVKRLALAKKLHLKVVDENGNELFCRSFMVTGSRIQTETRCLTAQQLDHYDERMQRDVDQVFKVFEPSGPSAMPSPGK
jgi:hypothetical protein